MKLVLERGRKLNLYSLRFFQHIIAPVTSGVKHYIYLVVEAVSLFRKTPHPPREVRERMYWYLFSNVATGKKPQPP